MQFDPCWNKTQNTKKHEIFFDLEWKREREGKKNWWASQVYVWHPWLLCMRHRYTDEYWRCPKPLCTCVTTWHTKTKQFFSPLSTVTRSILSEQRLVDFKSVCLARQKIRLAGFSGSHALANAARWNNQLRLPNLGWQKIRTDFKSINLYFLWYTWV